jgi:hypothetical protein
VTRTFRNKILGVVASGKKILFEGGRKMNWEVKYYPEYWDRKKLA